MIVGGAKVGQTAWQTTQIRRRAETREVLKPCPSQPCPPATSLLLWRADAHCGCPGRC
jgi:hypothetical protein